MSNNVMWLVNERLKRGLPISKYYPEVGPPPGILQRPQLVQPGWQYGQQASEIVLPQADGI